MYSGVRDMAQLINVLVTEADDLNFISAIHMVEGEN